MTVKFFFACQFLKTCPSPTFYTLLKLEPSPKSGPLIKLPLSGTLLRLIYYYKVQVSGRYY